jgi:hypothetical protein
MKKQTKTTLSLLLATAFFGFNGCKKDKTKTELLTDGSWKLSAFTINPAIDVNGDGVLDTDLYNLVIQNCSKDDFVTFKTGGTLTSDEGATKCSTSSPQTTSGTWAFADGEAKINITSDGNTIPTATIGTLDASTFKISYQDSLGNSVVTNTLTWSKK